MAKRLTVPQIDGGGDEAHEIYVERHDGLILYHAASDRARTVRIGGQMHEHCGEHNGRWVYRCTE